MKPKPKKDKQLDAFIDDIDAAKNAPNWIRHFRDAHYARGRLPFLVMYQAVAIAGREGSPLFKNKGAAIAIATKQLQDKKHLLEGSQHLSVSGDFREIAVLKSLGESRAKGYVDAFEAM